MRPPSRGRRSAAPGRPRRPVGRGQTSGGSASAVRADLRRRRCGRGSLRNQGITGLEQVRNAIARSVAVDTSNGTVGTGQGNVFGDVSGYVVLWWGGSCDLLSPSTTQKIT